MESIKSLDGQVWFSPKPYCLTAVPTVINFISISTWECNLEWNIWFFSFYKTTMERQKCELNYVAEIETKITSNTSSRRNLRKIKWKFALCAHQWMAFCYFSLFFDSTKAFIWIHLRWDLALETFFEHFRHVQRDLPPQTKPPSSNTRTYLPPPGVTSTQRVIFAVASADR